MGSYTPINWENNIKTPLNADNLGEMDSGIYEAHMGHNTPEFENLDINMEPQESSFVEPFLENEQMSGILTKITRMFQNVRFLLTKPHIVERGESGLWTYTKWSDGEVELRARLSVACATNTKIHDYLYRSEQQTVELPFTVYDVTPQLTMMDHNTWCSSAYFGKDVSQIKFVIFRGYAYEEFSWSVSALVKGKWKV
jgi:hypothetical protein